MRGASFADCIATILSAEILVTGCYAQRAPQELGEIEGVRWVVGNSHKTEIADLVSIAHEDYHGQMLVGDMLCAEGFSGHAGRRCARRPHAARI